MVTLLCLPPPTRRVPKGVRNDSPAEPAKISDAGRFIRSGGRQRSHALAPARSMTMGRNRYRVRRTIHHEDPSNVSRAYICSFTNSNEGDRRKCPIDHKPTIAIHTWECSSRVVCRLCLGFVKIHGVGSPSLGRGCASSSPSYGRWHGPKLAKGSLIRVWSHPTVFSFLHFYVRK